MCTNHRYRLFQRKWKRTQVETYQHTFGQISPASPEFSVFRRSPEPHPRHETNTSKRDGPRDPAIIYAAILGAHLGLHEVRCRMVDSAEHSPQPYLREQFSEYLTTLGEPPWEPYKGYGK